MGAIVTRRMRPMSPSHTDSGSDRFILTVKAAYWAALLIIAAMALTAYLFVQQMMATHQRDEALLSLVETQKTLSQRIIFLANAARTAAPDEKRPLISSLRTATRQFETNYDLILDRLQIAPDPVDRVTNSAGEDILFGGPYRLDHFTTSLATNGWRFIAALETRMGFGFSRTGYEGDGERATLDETVADATLAGYTALGDRLTLESDEFLAWTLDVHRMLFYATIGVICLVALFIFRPMTEVIRRRTGELVDARNSMAFIAIHDGLTGLHNRTFMRDHFDTLIKLAHRRGERLAVIQIDLDRFKQINDTLGHAAGDFVLVTTAERMRKACRASDICARLGGDEFVMVMPGAGTSDDIDGLARRILDQINQPIVYEGATIFSGASAGIAVYPLDADNATDLLVHADLALYAAKKQGGGGFSFFSDELRHELEHRKQLERDRT